MDIIFKVFCNIIASLKNDALFEARREKGKDILFLSEWRNKK